VKEKLLILSGANLNLLGKRQPEIYGNETLDSIVHEICCDAGKNNFKVVHKQSNSESELIEFIHESNIEYMIINLGAYTHTSIAIRDAILAKNIKFIEVHLSNIYSREDFRHKSYFSDIAEGVIVGLGKYGYMSAYEYFKNIIIKQKG
jgi:3-dehydroquinate dehydratase-2